MAHSLASFFFLFFHLWTLDGFHGHQKRCRKKSRLRGRYHFFYKLFLGPQGREFGITSLREHQTGESPQERGHVFACPLTKLCGDVELFFWFDIATAA